MAPWEARKKRKSKKEVKLKPKTSWKCFFLLRTAGVLLVYAEVLKVGFAVHAKAGRCAVVRNGGVKVKVLSKLGSGGLGFLLGPSCTTSPLP